MADKSKDAGRQGRSPAAVPGGKPDPTETGDVGHTPAGEVGTTTGNAGIDAGSHPDRYDPENATGTDPALSSGRNSGELADASAGTTAATAHVSDPTTAAGNRPEVAGGMPRAGETDGCREEFGSGSTGAMPRTRRLVNARTPQPAGVLFMDPDGGDVTPDTLGSILSGITAAVKTGDFLAAGERVGDFLKLGIGIFREQFRPKGQFADDAAAERHAEEWRAFDRAATEWDGVKDGATAKLPTMIGNRDGHNFGAASGAMSPLGKPADAAGRGLGTWVTLMELVSRLVEELRKLKK